MPRLPVRWLPVRLERLLGLWRLRRLLLVLGLLSLVLDQITLSRCSPTRSQGRVLRDPACCLVCAAESASNSPYSWPERNGAATVIDVADAGMTDHDLRIGLRW